MLIDADYRGYRIEVYADGLQGEWDAVVRIRRVRGEERDHIERVTCKKATPGLAEQHALEWAKRWVDE